MRHVGKHNELASNSQNDSTLAGYLWAQCMVHVSEMVLAVPPQHPLCTSPASWRGQWVSPCRTLFLQGQMPPALG